MALNNPQTLICYKIQQTKQQTNQSLNIIFLKHICLQKLDTPKTKILQKKKWI